MLAWAKFFLLLYLDERMSQNKDISSTEQLLDVIRGTKEMPRTITSRTRTAPVSSPKPRVASGKLDSRKAVVGISYDSAGIWLVAVEPSGRVSSVVDYAYIDVELPEDVEPKTIVDILRKEGYHQRFSLKKVPVWFLLRSEAVEQWSVTVPKKVEGKEEGKAVFWAAKAKKTFSDTESIFDYYRIDECMEKGVEKLCMGAFTVSRSYVYGIRDGFAAAGISLAGISSFSLCASHLLDMPPKGIEEPPVAVIRVDREWSRIDLFHRHVLAFSRRIKTGVESFALSIQEGYRPPSTSGSVQAGDIELELNLEEGADTAKGLNFENDSRKGDRLNLEDAWELLQGHQGTQGGMEYAESVAVSDEDLMELIEPAVQRLLSQIERTFDHFRVSMKVPALKKIFFVGQIAQFKSVVSYIGTQLDIDVDVLDPFAVSSVTTALPVPSSIVERTAYAAALSGALSNREKTCNFLYNYHSRLYDGKLKKVNSILLSGFLTCALAVAGYFLYNQKVLNAKTVQYQKITKELANYSGDVTGKKTQKLLGEFTQQNLFLKKYTERFVPVGVFAEIAHITPSSVAINNLIYNNKEEGKSGSIVLDGIVVGEPSMLDSYLSNYMAILDDSVLFSEPVIQKRSRLKSGRKEKISFVVNISLK